MTSTTWMRLTLSTKHFRTIPSLFKDPIALVERCQKTAPVSLAVNIVEKSEKPVVIGRSIKLRRFHNLDPSAHSVKWHANKKAWMWRVTDFNRCVKLQKHHVQLSLYNAPSHPHDVNIKCKLCVYAHRHNITAVTTRPGHYQEYEGTLQPTPSHPRPRWIQIRQHRKSASLLPYTMRASGSQQPWIVSHR